jgi:hypothetical protein
MSLYILKTIMQFLMLLFFMLIQTADTKNNYSKTTGCIDKKNGVK